MKKTVLYFLIIQLISMELISMDHAYGISDKIFTYKKPTSLPKNSLDTTKTLIVEKMLENLTSKQGDLALEDVKFLLQKPLQSNNLELLKKVIHNPLFDKIPAILIELEILNAIERKIKEELVLEILQKAFNLISKKYLEIYLIESARFGYFDVVNYLLEKNIDVNAVNDKDITPLIMASNGGHAKVVELLLKVEGIGVNKANKNGWTPLYSASFNGYDQVVELLLKAPNIEVNKENNDSVTPLLTASYKGYAKVVELLLKAQSIEINKTGEDEATPLFMASQNGHEEVVDLLLKAPGVEVNKAIKNEVTPLLIASEKGHEKVVELLLKAPGIEVNKPRRDRVTPLFMASQRGHEKVVELLLKAPGIEVNKVFNNEFTPLYIASYNGHKNIVKLLLKSGADFNHETNGKETAYDIALAMNHLEIASLLNFYKYMADHRLQNLLSVTLENVNLSELEDKIPLRYMPSYLIFISTNKDEEEKAIKIFNEYNKNLFYNAKNDSKYKIEEDDRCIVCHGTEKEIEEDNRNNQENNFLFKNKCCKQPICSSCYFNFYIHASNLDRCFICQR